MMYPHAQTRMQSSRIGMALRIRGLTWCQRLYQWYGSPSARRRDEPTLGFDHYWDPACEQVRPQPSECALEQVAIQGGASQRLLLYSLLP